MVLGWGLGFCIYSKAPVILIQPRTAFWVVRGYTTWITYTQYDPWCLSLHPSPLLSGDDELSSFLSLFHHFPRDHKWGLLCDFSYSSSLPPLLSSFLGVNGITGPQFSGSEGPYPLLSSSCPLWSPCFVTQNWLILIFYHIALKKKFFFLAALGLCWDMQASLVATQGLGWPAARGILVPQPGMELLSLALEGGFLTTGPPAKSLLRCFLRPWHPKASKRKPLKFSSGQMELWCPWEAEGTKFLRNLKKLGLLVTFR